MIITNRWTPARKFQAVEGVRKGLYTREDLMAANHISEEEMVEWEVGASLGVRGLKISGTSKHVRARLRIMRDTATGCNSSET